MSQDEHTSAITRSIEQRALPRRLDKVHNGQRVNLGGQDEVVVRQAANAGAADIHGHQLASMAHVHGGGVAWMRSQEHTAAEVRAAWSDSPWLPGRRAHTFGGGHLLHAGS